MTIKTADKHIKRTARIKTVRLGDLRVSPAAQREFKRAHGQNIADNFDLDLAGTFTLSLRDGTYWIVDGQHRFYGLKEHVKSTFGDEWEDWTIEAWTHEGLTEAQEAELFLTFNSSKPVSGIDKFRVAVTAERDVETDVNRVVLANGLRVSHTPGQHAIVGVGALLSTYSRGGAAHLREVIVTLREAWEGFDMDAALIHATSDVLTRYAGAINAARLASQLGALRNGSAGVYQEAHRVKLKFGSTARAANAAAMVEIYNKGLRGKGRLEAWFKGDEEAVA